MASLIRSYSSLLNDFFSDPFWGGVTEGVGERGFSAPSEVRCGEDVCCAEIDLPGVKREDIDISCEGGRLTVTARRKRGKEVAAKYHNEFHVSDTLDASKIEAKLEDGVLCVTVPRKKKEESKIKIKIS